MEQSNFGSVLICDDDEKTTIFLEQILMKKGKHKVTQVKSGEECLKHWNKSIDIVILDYQLPNLNGHEVLKRIRKMDPNAVIIIATGHSNESLVIDSLRYGAYNFIKKPYDINYLLSTVEEGIIESKSRKLSSQVKGRVNIKADPIEYAFKSKSPVINKINNTIEKIAKRNISILLTGNSGTGKEFFAQEIYKMSRRKNTSFIPINCPAIPSTLAESELFGHEKGSFTGADSQKKGKLELANNGILFLDEIGDLSLDIQAKFLRVLQEREIYRIGGTEAIPLNIMVISATSKDLRLEIEEGRFRSDLYYRIADINLRIPDLKDRSEDIEELINLFVSQFAIEHNEDKKIITNDAIEMIKAYDWPGNIRELKSFIRKVMILFHEPLITQELIDDFFSNQVLHINKELKAKMQQHIKNSTINNSNIKTHSDNSAELYYSPPNAESDSEYSKVEVDIYKNNNYYTEDNDILHNNIQDSISVTDMETNLLKRTIIKHRGNLSAASRALEISRSTLYRKVKKYKIDIKQLMAEMI